MKKKILFPVVLILAVCAILVACAGKGEKLATPTVLTISGTTITWTEVSNASSYLIRINNNTPILNDSNSYSLADLSTAEIYYISVQAVGDGKDYLDSDWSIEKEYLSVKINFEKYDGIGTANNTVVAFKSKYGTLPSNLTRIGCTFAGWWTNKNGTGTEVTSDSTVLNAEEHTLYAKWDHHFSYNYYGGERKIAGLTALGRTLSNLEIPSTFVDGKVTSIADSAFSDHTSLKSIVIPDTIIDIGANAFYNCSSLTSVTIPDSVTGLGAKAFYNCSSLSNVKISNRLTQIKYNTFLLCKNLTNIVIPDSITSVGVNAFDGTGMYFNSENSVIYADKWVVGCRGNVTTVNLRFDTVGICENALANCSNLTSIRIPKSVIHINPGAFYRAGLNNLTFEAGSNLTTIEQTSFYNCSGLTNIIIPDSVKEIGHYAFLGCSSLTSILIPNSVTDIGIQAFDGDNKLTIYAEASTAPSNWYQHESRSWNCSNRPVVWGCNLSVNKTHVESFTKMANSIVNSDAINDISAPYREGYTFVEWNTMPDGSGVAYQLTNNTQYTAIPNGTTLYTIWQ